MMRGFTMVTAVTVELEEVGSLWMRLMNAVRIMISVMIHYTIRVRVGKFPLSTCQYTRGNAVIELFNVLDLTHSAGKSSPMSVAVNFANATGSLWSAGIGTRSQKSK